MLCCLLYQFIIMNCIYYNAYSIFCISSCVYSSLSCLRIFTGLGFTHTALIQNFLCAVVCVCILTETPCVAMCSNILQCVRLCAVVFRFYTDPLNCFDHVTNVFKTRRTTACTGSIAMRYAARL